MTTMAGGYLRRLRSAPGGRRKGCHYVRLVGKLDVDEVKEWCAQTGVEYPSRQLFLLVEEDNMFARFLEFKDERSAVLFRLRWF